MTYQPTGVMQLDAAHQARRGGIPTGYLNPAQPSPHELAMHAHQAGLVNNLQDDNISAMVGQFGALSMTSGNITQPGTAMPGVAHNAYMNPSDGNIVFTAPYPGAMHPMVPDHAFGPAAYPLPYPSGYAPTYPMMPFTPGRAVTYGGGERLPREVPGLENRRGSYSTSATESNPATPFLNQGVDRINGTRVASLDRSNYTTPSPRETMAHYMANNAHAKPIVDPELDRLLMIDPPVPKAVPAVWTDHIKPLEQCLENRIQGNKNVYIRGLHPTTDDELLLKYAERFGEVEQSKAIIDTATGACKGFGFAKFKEARDSEKCIRGFYRLGYEVGFARESFNARLKAEGDEGSTNLYISNLPKDVNENMLIQIFEPFHIVSSKILRDSMGNSRGVGFARFESREVCEKVIKGFHGIPVGTDGYMMQVRYADTPSQKELKRITSERRQYRTNEYNIGAYGTHAVGLNPSIYNAAMWNRRPGIGPVPGHNPYGVALRTVSHNDLAENIVPIKPRGQLQSTTASGTASSDDGSGDEGVTIVDSPIVANGSTQSSPSAKKQTA